MKLNLFGFQAEAVEFFLDKKSVFLGDDMGLGKTLQAVTLDLRRREKNPTLVDKPKTLVVTYLGIFSGWADTFQRQSELRVATINPKKRNEFMFKLFNDEADVYIVHWQVLRLLPELQEINWFHIIADECHALQNRKAKQSVALKTLKTWYKTGLSGTPAYDKPDDLWSVLNWLYPKHWSSFWRYFNEHVLFVEYNGYRTVIGVNNEEKLQREMAGFYLRRRKEKVLEDLPDKYYSERIVDLHPQQRRAYEQMKKDMLAWVGEHENEPVAAPVIIAQLTRLQQFSDAYGELELVPKIDRTTGEEYVQTRMRLAEPSTKLDEVMAIISSTGEQVVVFSQFSQVIELLRTRLQKAGITNGIFIGATSPEERARIIEEFQAGRLRVFAGTIAAGGIGITLTAASTVVFIDRSWSASLNIQAEDRCHRIGQQNAVHIVDIISKDTIDAKRIQRINLQWSWIRRLIGDGPVEDGTVEAEPDYDDSDW